MRLKVVIAGLDPAIHPLRMMDTRVKPAYDAVHKESFAEISSANRRTAVDHHRLPGHEVAGCRSHEHRGTGDLVTVNGVRVTAEDGSWGLVRASSNKPELVVVVESPVSEQRMRDMFEAMDSVLRTHPEVGEYNQKI
jgi:phosphomannomutase